MYDKEEGYKRWGYMGFLENPRYDYEGWGLPPHREQHYLLQRTGDSTLADRANGRPVYTNDPYREVQPLELKKTDKDASSYYCFYCEPDREAVEYDGEDKNNLFINYQLAVPKSSLSAYVPLQQI
ncbi:MAG: hypothetical protein LBD11_02990 [Candidatus Peribacteria bacterium]|jgi:hypothetical protein|nr:hypothetical protein [Candidatus Peribacteria bacterium]